MKKFSLLFFALVLLSACTSSENPDGSFSEMYYDGSPSLEKKIEEKTNEALNTSLPESAMDTDMQLQPPQKGDMVATIETNKGTIKLRFFPEQAPELSKNFMELAKKGYYDDVIFHRVIKGFMIQGGDPEGTGMGGESYKGSGLADEPGALKLKHYPGAVACAKSSLPNSIGSQFYIVHEQARFLDGSYSVFGQVYEGMDVVNAIANVQTDRGDKPVEEVVMKKVTVGTFE